MKQVIGLIGGIASGKSLASQFFHNLGIEVIDADAIARDVVKQGRPILMKIAEHFGTDVLDAEGKLNRARLRELIFANPKERLWLEHLMHPVIRQKIDAAIDSAQGPYCIVAIPLLKRREDYPKLTYILMLDLPQEEQIKRLMVRDQISQTMAEKILAAQPTRETRLTLADEIIENKGTPEILQQKIIALDTRLRRTSC